MTNYSVAFFQLIALFMLTTNAQKRLYQPGNITIGVTLHSHQPNSTNACGKFYSIGLGQIEAISYAVDQINKNASILRNVTLGIDLRDSCNSPIQALSSAHSFGLNNILNNLLVVPQRSKEMGSSFALGSPLNITPPVAAVIATEDSSSTKLVSSLLQVKMFDFFSISFLQRSI